MDQILVLRCSPWSFADEQTGVVRKGLTLYFVNDVQAEDGLGAMPQKISAPFEHLDFFKKADLPAIVDVRFATRAGAGGKSVSIVKQVSNARSSKLFGAK